MSLPPKKKKLSKEWHDRFPDLPRKAHTGPHLTVARIGTQYDPEEVVCITEDAKEVLEGALATEINELREDVRFHEEDADDPEYLEEAEEKLKVANQLYYQVMDMKVCD